MIIETNEYRELLKTEIAVFELAEDLAKTYNKRFNIKIGVLVVKGSQIVCGNFASFRSSTYKNEYMYHPEESVIDMFPAELDDLIYYVAKVNIKNEPQASRPCRECMKSILGWDQVKEIIYRDDKLRIVKEVLE